MRKFGRYRLVEKIAQGGMAEVWRAKQPVVEGLERDVVIKRILPSLANDPDFVRMFLNEARLAARFNHSNIAQIHDVGEAEGAYFIAMEFVDGADLGRVMRKAWAMGHWIARPLAIRIIAACCEGLHYAHTRTDEAGRPLRIVHRDMSPANILISVDGAVKLADFGIAKAADLVSVTRAGSIKGKFAYMSPEQAKGRAVDHRSDLFSVALVLYELLTGIRPLRRDSDAQTHRAAVDCEIQPPSEVSDVPPELDALVMRALAKNPDDRYADVLQFQMALEGFLVEQRWVATSAQVAELMRILFPEGVRPELPAGVSSDPGEAGSEPELLEATLPGRRSSPPAPVPGPPRALEVIAGPDIGQRYALDQERVVVGRVRECDVQLGDRSISRRHCELLSTANGVLLRDLASGNGTRVNGEEVTERLLVHGDVVELGLTRLRFVEPAPSREQDPAATVPAGPDAVASSPERSAAGPLAADPILAVPSASAGSTSEAAVPQRAVSEEDEGEDDDDAAPAGPPLLNARQRRVLVAAVAISAVALGIVWVRSRPPREDPQRMAAQERMEQARLAYAAGRRDEAVAHALAAERLAPGIDVDGLAERARRDQAAAEQLRAVRLLLEAKKFDEAETVLHDVRPVSEELRATVAQLRTQLQQGRQRDAAERFDAHLAAFELEGARALIASLAEADRENAAARLHAAEAAAEQRASAARATAAAGRAGVEQRLRAQRAAELSAIFAGVNERIGRGDYVRAVLEAEVIARDHASDAEVRERAVRLQRQLPVLDRALEQAGAAIVRRDHRAAVAPLRRARTLAAELLAPAPVRQKLDALFVETALHAAHQELAEQDTSSATTLYLEVLEIAPQEQRARDGLARAAPPAR